MNIWVILLAAFLVLELLVAAALLRFGTSAILHTGRIARQLASNIAGLGRVLRSIYDDTVRQSLPDDFHDLLGQLNPQPARVAPRRRS